MANFNPVLFIIRISLLYKVALQLQILFSLLQVRFFGHLCQLRILLYGVLYVLQHLPPPRIVLFLLLHHRLVKFPIRSFCILVFFYLLNYQCCLLFHALVFSCLLVLVGELGPVPLSVPVLSVSHVLHHLYLLRNLATVVLVFCLVVLLHLFVFIDLVLVEFTHLQTIFLLLAQVFFILAFLIESILHY